MAEKIIGCDISKWQSALKPETVQKFKQQGVKFVYQKFSQGTSYADPTAVNNTKLLQANGILVGPYHFVDVSNALYQYNWYVKCMGDFQFDLPPALDCEAYTSSLGDHPVTISELRELHSNQNTFRRNRKMLFTTKSGKPLSSTGYQFIRAGMKVGLDHFVFNAIYGLAYPTQATTDSMGMKLTTWMKNQTKLAKFAYPVIYTNAGSGNRIFTATSMSRYALWVASWKISQPIMPNVWKNKPYIIWQDNVVDGTPYGIDGQLDHDFWGNYMEFPGSITPPPPPPVEGDEIDVTVKFPNGKIYSGLLKKEA